jgi:hypothetical protein
VKGQAEGICGEHGTPAHPQGTVLRGVVPTEFPDEETKEAICRSSRVRT